MPCILSCKLTVFTPFRNQCDYGYVYSMAIKLYMDSMFNTPRCPNLS